MALTKKDVLDTLADPVIRRMNFWVGNVHVSGDAYDDIRDLIDDESIQVIEGTNPDNAYYNGRDDTLTTQNVNPPADLDARALLLHECTHALVDQAEIEVTRLTGETAAYLAQHTYMLLSNPRWTVAPNNKPWQTFFEDVVALVKKFKLDKPEGFGARIWWHDYEPLLDELHKLNIYQSLQDDEPAWSDGITPRWF
jgi:hypothetical protein